MKYCSFVENSRKAFDDCFASIKRHYGSFAPDVVTEWKDWGDNILPLNDNVDDYVAT